MDAEFLLAQRLWAGPTVLFEAPGSNAGNLKRRPRSRSMATKTRKPVELPSPGWIPTRRQDWKIRVLERGAELVIHSSALAHRDLVCGGAHHRADSRIDSRIKESCARLDDSACSAVSRGRVFCRIPNRRT